MEGLLIVGVVVLGLFWLFSSLRDTAPPKTQASSAPKRKPSGAEKAKQEWLADIAEWLPQRWERAAREKASGNLVEFREWYFDDVTERQQARLADIDKVGLNLDAQLLTKGQASDLIGLFEDPTPDELNVLRFFKVAARGMSQTKARDQIARLFKDPSKQQAWEQRPPKPMQKEFYVFFGLPVPKGMTYKQMQADIDDNLENMDDDAADEWDAYESIYDDFCDPEFRADSDIRKVSLKVYREFILKKRSDGVRLQNLDAFDVADEITEAHPELSRL